jgi:hypothetical protein
MLKRLTLPFIIGLCVIFFGSFIVTFFNLYITYPYIDKLLHISGGFIAVWFFSRLWKNKLIGFSTNKQLVLCIAFVVIVGLFWELMEYSTSVPPLINYPSLQRYIYIGSITDTLGDLLADIFGGSLFSIFISRIDK